MSQMPEIKPSVNQAKERDEKKGGLLGLLSRLSGGGSGGGAMGGIGGAGGAAGGGLGGLAAGGGILATKAGLIGLILAGTTVAGGIGMVGWTAFGPGQNGSASNPALQLFASKPKESANAFGVAPVAKDGASSSLNYLAQANAPKGGPGEGDAATTDATAGAATATDAAASANATPHMGETVGANNGAAPKAGLQNVKKLGELSKSFGGGSSGGASASAQKVNMGDASATASNARGTKGALGGGIGARGGSQSIGRGLSRARNGSATRQAMNALGENRRAYSSQAGGRTYDGGVAQGNGTSGVDAGLPGAGLTSDSKQPTSTPNSAAQKKELEAPPTPSGKNVTPWQNAINMAGMMAAAALMLIMVAKTMKGIAYPMKVALAALVAILGAAVIAIGAQVSGGKYKQQLQGGLLAAAGLGIVVSAAGLLMEANQENADANKPATDKPATDKPATDKPATDKPATDKPASGFSMADGFVYIGGGIALVGVVGAMLSKPKQYPIEEFDGKKPPDIGYHYEVKPEERSRYTA